MTDLESVSHNLVARLKYLLSRLGDEFFHVHPDLDSNGLTTSLAFSSILNEALNLQEAIFAGKGSNFWGSIKKWGDLQNWTWAEIEIRFTRWPTLATLHPFALDGSGNLIIKGRDTNNDVKHGGKLATLSAVVNSCAATWFLVLETARETEIFLSETDINDLSELFDCYDLIYFRPGDFGISVVRPLVNRVQYPMVRGRSEESLAMAAYERRLSKWKR